MVSNWVVARIDSQLAIPESAVITATKKIKKFTLALTSMEHAAISLLNLEG